MALAVLLPDADDRYADAAVNRALKDGIVVPALWPYEVQNGLLVSRRRDRISDANLRDALALVATWTIALEAPHAIGEDLRLANELRLTVNDASYLAVARRHDAPLATNDKRLQAAAREVGVRLLEIDL